ncbi:hypothetical protein L218DRAFT_871892, partial [Marasmius fiardii PR-910]
HTYTSTFFSEEQICQTVKVIHEAFNREFFLPALGDRSLVEPFVECMVRATVVGGQLWIIDSPDTGIVASGLYFGPGQRSFGSEDQKKQGFNNLMGKLDMEKRKWFTEYFITEMLHNVDEIHGTGVQDQNYYLQLLGVLPEYQGKGIAKSLLSHVEAKVSLQCYISSVC